MYIYVNILVSVALIACIQVNRWRQAAYNCHATTCSTQKLHILTPWPMPIRWWWWWFACECIWIYVCTNRLCCYVVECFEFIWPRARSLPMSLSDLRCFIPFHSLLRSSFRNHLLLLFECDLTAHTVLRSFITSIPSLLLLLLWALLLLLLFLLL